MAKTLQSQSHGQFSQERSLWKLCVLLPLFIAGLLLLANYEARAAAVFVKMTAHHRGTAPSSCSGNGGQQLHNHPLLRTMPQSAGVSANDSLPPRPEHLLSPSQEAVAQSRAQLQAFLANSSSRWFGANTANTVATRGHERGILIAAGGRKLLTHLVVQLKVLRETLHCTLPVEVAWQGPREMDAATLSALQQRFGPLSGFDVQAQPTPPYLRSAASLSHWAGATTRWVGVALTRWVGKVAALLHCSFREVLLLDSDNLPLLDPTYLFEDRLFKQHGNLFWPDFWSNWVQPGVYPWLGLNRTVVQPMLHAGAGFTGRDAESGMLLIDRARWLKVLHWALWINSWHKQLYYHMIHGDKDTFALAFALAGHADKYRQVSVVPGGVFRWGKGQLLVKATAPNMRETHADGWQLIGAVQHDDTGRPAFFHRTMNKLSPDEEPWPAELVTGPLPSRWLQYYLAHDSKGPTKGVWWEHVAPDSAFAVAPEPPANSTSAAPRPEDSCGGGRDTAALAQPEQASVPGNATVPAARVDPALAQHYQPLQVINASLVALAWLKSPAGRAAFPSIAPGSRMP